MRKYLNLRPNITLALIFTFSINIGGPCPSAQAQEFYLPEPGVMVHLSPPLDPPMLKGIKVHPDNPFRFDFILDKGDSFVGRASEGDLKQESTKLIKYFLASLTIPEKDLWVNLSPYEKDRIVPQSFGLTEMGRDLLAEDYMLKQITASLIYPEDVIGKKFWKRVYQETAQKFGTINIPINTFNKVWIVPEKAVVYENAKAGTAYIVESKLKVMLEQDYLALEKNQPLTPGTKINALGSQIIREIVLPELTKEINENKNFAQLRQVYNSLILATWYKKKIKESILEQVYADKNKIAGLLSTRGHVQGRITKNSEALSPSRFNEVEAIYQRYLQAFKKGVYNYIKEEKRPYPFDSNAKDQMIVRKYFSGGLDFAMVVNDVTGMHGMQNMLETTQRIGPNDLTNTHDLAEVSTHIDAALNTNVAVSSTLDRAMNSGDIFRFNTGVLQPVQKLGEEERVKEISNTINLINERVLGGEAVGRISNYQYIDIRINHLINALPESERKEYQNGLQNIHIVVEAPDPFAQLKDILWFVPSINRYIHIHLKPNDDTTLLISYLFSLLKGDELEVDFTSASRRQKKMRADFWDTYSNHYARTFYHPYIHPLAADAVLSLIDAMVEKGQKEIKMVDIFGGDGSFLEIFHHKFMEHFKGREMPHMTYYLVEDNEVSYEAAKSRLSGIPGAEPPIKSDLLAGGALPKEILGADIITSIGGGFNFQVANKREAKRLMRSIREALNEHGRLIVTGLSMIHFSSNDFRDNGFNLLNMAVPLNLIIGKPPRQMYILGKAAIQRKFVSRLKALTRFVTMVHHPSNKTGGIDLTSSKALVIQNSGQGIKFYIDPAMLKQLQNATGFVPVIINIQPMTDLRKFLGISETTPPGNHPPLTY